MQGDLRALSKPKSEVARGFRRAIGEPKEGLQPSEQILEAGCRTGLLIPQPRPVGGGLDRARPEATRAELDAEPSLGLALCLGLFDRAYGGGVAISAVRLI